MIHICESIQSKKVGSAHQGHSGLCVLMSAVLSVCHQKQFCWISTVAKRKLRAGGSGIELATCEHCHCTARALATCAPSNANALRAAASPRRPRLEIKIQSARFTPCGASVVRASPPGCILQ